MGPVALTASMVRRYESELSNLADGGETPTRCGPFVAHRQIGADLEADAVDQKPP